MRDHLMTIATAIVLFSAVFIACSKSKGGDGSGTGGDSNFDKAAMLTAITDQLIIPGYSSLQQKINALQTTANNFADAPSVITQAAAIDAIKQAYLQYENVEAYNNLTPASVILFESFMNSFGGLTSSDILLNGFSVDITTIEDRIVSGSYNLGDYSNSNFYAQGFPALCYLVASPDAIDKFNSNTVNRVNYIKDVAARMKSLTDKVVSDWAIYRSTFISNTQSNVGSPIGNMVNAMAYEMDVLKGPRIGWPFGKQSNGQVFATKVEGYYIGSSVALAVTNLKNLKTLYTAGGSGKGFSDYLAALGKTALNTQILSQFDVVIAKLEAIPDPLSTSLTTQAAVVNTAYGEIQKLLTLLKTDMASALGVQISFMDNDGD